MLLRHDSGAQQNRRPRAPHELHSGSSPPTPAQAGADTLGSLVPTSRMFMKNGGSQPAAQVKSPAISSIAVGGIGRQNTGALTSPPYVPVLFFPPSLHLSVTIEVDGAAFNIVIYLSLGLVFRSDVSPLGLSAQGR